MRLSRKFSWWVLLAALPLAVAGCGGVSASHTVSPASFFLPGLIRNDAPAPVPAPAPKLSAELASAN